MPARVAGAGSRSSVASVRVWPAARVCDGVVPVVLAGPEEKICAAVLANWTA